jgi:16S rRNA (guanine(966)-N(2))-methyltransferase RsmD
MLRVIGGKYKHRILDQPPSDLTRPTKDIAKGGLFNSIGNSLVKRSFLDLYSGSGAIAIEALSRGAERVVAVDKSSIAYAVIKKNIANLGIAEGIDVICSSAHDAVVSLASKGEKFDYIFLDPPYDDDIDVDFIDSIVALGVTTEKTIFILETDKKRNPEEFLHYAIKELHYGRTYIYLMRRKQ